MNFSFSPFIEGMSLCFSLIIAIGIQNAFVLKQGILKNRVFFVALLCSSIDAFLIVIGVYVFGNFLSDHHFLLWLFSWGGVLFVFDYSIMAFYSSFKTQTLDISSQSKINTVKEIFIKVFLVSVINPNAFLDSIVLIGSISTQYEKEDLFSFTLGASSASYVWFFLLSFAARFLQPFFLKPVAWKILDFIIGCTMFIIGISLLSKLKLGF